MADVDNALRKPAPDSERASPEKALLRNCFAAVVLKLAAAGAMKSCQPGERIMRLLVRLDEPFIALDKIQPP